MTSPFASPYWPPASRAGTVLIFTVAVLLGYLVRPKLWILGPFGAVRRAWAQVAQESGWNPDAAGDEGGSVGLLQFSSDKADWYADGWRSSPFVSGWAWGRYVNDAGMAWILRFAIPVYGYAWMRYAWTHGAAGDPPSISTVLDQVGSERSPEGYTAALLLTAPFSLALGFLLVRYLRRRR